MIASKKTELIQKTYELLKETAPDNIKIRTIAAVCNCTPTVVYKHFDDLDSLVRFASVLFLEEYIEKVQNTLSETTDPMEMLIVMWREFAESAFQNVEVYLLLFWGRYKENLGDTIFDYYQIFPDKWKNLGGLFTSTFFNSDIEERNYMIVRRASAMGYFHFNDVRIICDMQCYIMHGVLMDYKDSYREPGKAQEGVTRFMNLLNSSIEHYRIK